MPRSRSPNRSPQRRRRSYSPDRYRERHRDRGSDRHRGGRGRGGRNRDEHPREDDFSKRRPRDDRRVQGDRDSRSPRAIKPPPEDDLENVHPSRRNRRDDYPRSPLPTNAVAPTGRPAGVPDPDAPPPKEKEKVNFSNTGLLAAASNTLNNVTLKYSEPGDARKPPPSPAYKLFVFKESEIIDTIELSTRSCWLVGRDRAVADMAVDHPSCSKQHAVLQFRFTTRVNDMGDKKNSVKLYLMDLESANGTRLGDMDVEGSRFVEVRDGDLIRFGLSTREYVVMLDRD